MGQLIEEVKVWNTPIIGAFMLWKFTEGYIKGHPNGDAPIGLLHFIAGAILSNERLLKSISNNRPNLQSYVRGFEDAKDVDLLLGIQERIKAKKQYVLESIDIGVAEGLLVWDTTSGKIYSRPLENSPKRGNALKEIHSRNGTKAEILGKWFSEHQMQAICSYFKVVL